MDLPVVVFGDGSAVGLARPEDFLWRVALVAMLVLLPLVVFLPRVVRRRRLRCPARNRLVEVELVEAGLPGLRVPIRIRSCSAFDPPTAVTCAHHCLDDGHRCVWPPSRWLARRERPHRWGKADDSRLAG